MRSNRKIVVLTSLVAMLSLASALLLFLAPPPLAAEPLSGRLRRGAGRPIASI